MYFNKKYGHVGHVFQDRYKQINIHDDSYLVWLSLYIHLNPKVAGIISNPSEYLWSSCADFLEKRSDGLCDERIVKGRYSTKEYGDLLTTGHEILKSKKNLEQLLID